MTTDRQLITTRQLASMKGVSRQAVSVAVKREQLTPTLILENGHFLFDLDTARRWIES